MAQLDQLLQKYEFENSHLSKAIGTETDKQNIVNRQRRDVDKQTNEFEEKIRILEEEITKIKIHEIEKNQGIERLKNEAFILRDHKNTIRVRLDLQKENNKQAINKTEEMIRDGTHKLEKYLEKYEGIPAAKKILEERETREDLESRIDKMKREFSALKEKENEMKLFVDKQHFQVFKLNRTITNAMIESAEFRKDAKLKFVEILAIKEKINKQTTNQEIQQQQDANNTLQSKQHVTPHSEQLKFAKRIIILKENFEKDKNSNEQNKQQQTEEMDICNTSTSTPKITPIHMPSILLSPLNSLSNKSDTNTTQIPPKRTTPAFTIPQLKPQRFSTLTPSKNPPNYELQNPQRLKVPLPLETHSDTNTDTNLSTHISMDIGNQGQVDESEFRFGFLEEIQKNGNPFGTMEFETINRTDSGFVTDLFPGSGTGTNQIQEADNPFSFVP